MTVAECMLILVPLLLLIVLFAGTPDLHDALLKRLMECPR